jgi:hypothetical protein
MLDFIASFMRRELGTGIEKVLPPQWYGMANQILADWQHAVTDAQARATQTGNVVAEPCRRCGSNGVLSVDDQSMVYCHLCGSDSDEYGECERCGRLSVLSMRLSDDEYWCRNCEHELIASLTPDRELDLVRSK